MRTVLAAPLLLGAVVAALGALVLPLLVIGLALVVGWAVIAGVSWRSASAGFGGQLGGMSPSEAAQAQVLSALAAERFEDVAGSLCAALGLETPDLRVLVDPAPNAIATGARPGGVRVVLTTGLLSALDRIELEGVLAHELAHVKRLDTLSAGLCSSLLHGGKLPFPGARKVATWLEGANRELEADLAAVQVTRYPPGLIAALDLAKRVGACAPSAALGAGLLSDTRTQWLVPGSRESDGSGQLISPETGVFGLSERLEVLREL
ncbi:MAG: M48 family metalloprotease [Acidimicrobiales bacterium]